MAYIRGTSEKTLLLLQNRDHSLCYLTSYQTFKYKQPVNITKWSWNHEAADVLSGKDLQTCCPRGILVYLGYFCFLLLKFAKTQYPCSWLVTELFVEWVQQLNSLSKALEKKKKLQQCETGTYILLWSLEEKSRFQINSPTHSNLSHF